MISDPAHNLAIATTAAEHLWCAGPRVHVRLLQKDDIGAHYRRWFNDEEIRRFIKFARTAPSLKDLRAYWQRMHDDPGVDFLGFFLNADGRHIGNMKFETGPGHDEMHVGFLIGDPAWRRVGVLTETLHGAIRRTRELRSYLRRIYLTVAPDNEAAIGAFTKLGFVSTGVIDSLGDLEMDYVRS